MTLAIYCAGGLGTEMIGFARSINRWERIIFVDDVTDAVTCMEAPVYRWEQLPNLQEELEFVIASGEPEGRAALYHKIKAAGLPMATLISPYASISPEVDLGEGCVISDAATFSPGVCLEANVCINGRATLGHGAKIGKHCVIGTQVFIGGQSILEQKVYIAPGALVKDSVTIHESAIIGLGAVIVRNVRARSIMLGNPAKKIGDNTGDRVFDMM